MRDIKSEFPIFQNNPNLVYLDSAATTQKPAVVLDAVAQYYLKLNSNIHRGVYKIAEQSDKLWVEAHRKVADFIGAVSMEEIFFVRNATEGFNFLANTLSENLDLKAGDKVMISEMEHHSNIVPWQILAKKRGFEIVWIPVTENRELDYSFVEANMDGVKILSVVHASNVLGTINDIGRLAKIAHSAGALIIVDAAQSVATVPINVAELDIDFLCFSGHKLYAPNGSGAVYGKKSLLEKLEPWLGGGEMIRSVSKDGAVWNDLPWRFEAGTPDIAGAIGLMKGIEWIEDLRLSNDGGVLSSLRDLILYTHRGISQIPEVEVISADPSKIATVSLVSFTVDGVHAHDIASYLAEKDICIRAGYHCAEPLHKALQCEPSARVSLGLYNDRADIDKFLNALKECIQFFKGN